MNIFKQPLPGTAVDDPETIADIDSDDVAARKWATELPAANSVTECPKCGAALVRQRKYWISARYRDIEFLTVDCDCRYTVHEKTKDAVEASKPITFESLKLRDPFNCMHDWEYREGKTEGYVADCTRCGSWLQKKTVWVSVPGTEAGDGE